MWLIDKNISLYVNEHISKAIVDFFIWFSHWFNNGLAFIILVSIITKFEKKKMKKFIILMLILFLIVFSLKYTIARERPFKMLGINNLDNLNAFRSFPSGHSAFATLTLLFIISSENKLWIKMFTFILCIMIILSRVIINAHYLSDILGSIIITPCIYYSYEFVSKKYLTKHK